jgi:hypothetical protein
MKKHPRPSGEQRVARWRPFGERGLKLGPLFTRAPRNVATAKTSPPAEWAWLEFASQFVIFMGPIGAILLGSGSRWGFVIGLATQPFWFYTSFRHRQWGIFIASIFYAFGWATGVYRNF